MPFFELDIAQLPAYRSSITRPADFDTFWSSTLDEARSLPLAAKFEPVDVGLALVEVFDVTFAGWGGHPIKGWYIKPRGNHDAGAVVKFIGYNGGRGFPHEHLLWPTTGRPVLVMDTRGQGGARALAAASLDPSVKAVVADVPFLCDFPRAVTIAPRDPYGEVSRYLAVHRDMVQTAFATLNYFDVVNHVRTAKANALVSVAVMDNTCPPSTVYAAYNAYGGPTELVSYKFNAHER